MHFGLVVFFVVPMLLRAMDYKDAYANITEISRSDYGLKKSFDHLIDAIKRGDDRFVEYLLTYGETAIVNQRNSNEEIPLHIALSYGNSTIIGLLLQHGGRLGLSQKNYRGETPMCCAAYNSFYGLADRQRVTENLHYVIDQQVDIINDVWPLERVNSLLSYAVKCKDQKLIKACLNNNAWPSINRILNTTILEFTDCIRNDVCDGGDMRKKACLKECISRAHVAREVLRWLALKYHFLSTKSHCYTAIPSQYKGRSLEERREIVSDDNLRMFFEPKSAYDQQGRMITFRTPRPLKELIVFRIAQHCKEEYKKRGRVVDAEWAKMASTRMREIGEEYNCKQAQKFAGDKARSLQEKK